jgi:UDP-N-acetylmuramoylalanine-D-glutamate ligase
VQKLNKKTAFRHVFGNNLSSFSHCFLPVLFTPCTFPNSLVEAVIEAAGDAASGDTVLFSPSCSGLEQVRAHEMRGQKLCPAVKSIGRGECAEHPNMMVKFEGRKKAALRF